MTVIMFLPDRHSSGRFNNVMSDNICAAIIHIAVSEKKRFKFEMSAKVVVILALITRTAARCMTGSWDEARAIR